MPHVRAGDLDVHHQILGRDAGASGTVVMIHGLLVGSLAEWYLTCAPALAVTRRVLLYDLRGHGLTTRAPSGYDVATQAADLAALLAATGAPDPVDLVGHSFGGLVALRFALDHPSRVRRLALVDVPLPPSTLDEGNAADPAWIERVVASIPGLAARAGSGRRGGRLLASLAFLTQQCTLLADLAREADLPDAQLAAISCPTLLVFGEGSRCRPVGDRLARVMPDARLELLPGGHFVPLESPRELARLLVEHAGG